MSLRSADLPPHLSEHCVAGDFVWNQRSGKKIKVGRLVRMHSNEMEDIDGASAGDIVALFGVDCFSGDTFTDGKVEIAMTSIHVPAAVISLSISPADNKARINMSKALQRFTKEDPTFRVRTDDETGETIISGMGELHLEVYIERMKREYSAAVTTAPQVAYRETITREADFNYTHKKQTGGSGQYGKIMGKIFPNEGDFSFDDTVKGGNVPKEYILVEKGFRSMMAKGLLTGFPVVGVSVVLEDGASHSVDSSEMAFQEAARGAWRSVYQTKPAILEPIMKVELEGPEFHGAMVGTPCSVVVRSPAPRKRAFLVERAARRDVRLRHGSSVLHPGQGELLHGVQELRPRPDFGEGRGHREVRQEEGLVSPSCTARKCGPTARWVLKSRFMVASALGISASS